MKRILCVIRTSTDRQDIVSQHNDMIGFLSTKGYKEEDILWLECKGASARKANASYLQMLSDIKNICVGQNIKAVGLWHLNRLGRIESYLTQMKEFFIDHGIQMYVKTPELTLLNADGTYNMGNNIVFSVFSAVIPSETLELMEKLKRGKERSKELGKFNGGTPQFGFKVVDSYLVPDEEKMPIVKQMYECYASGNYSQESLKLEFEKRGTKISYTTLHDILQDEKYIPYVTQELFDKVTEVREKNRLNMSKASRHFNLCAKMLTCAYCGKHYTFAHDRWTCSTKMVKHRTNKECKESITIPDWVATKLVTETASLWYRETLREVQETNKSEYEDRIVVLNQKIQTSEIALSKIVNKYENLQNLYIDAEITKAVYEEKKLKIDAESEQLGNQIEMLNEELKGCQLAINAIEMGNNDNLLQQMLADIEKKETIRQIIKSVTISRTDFNGKSVALIILISVTGRVKQVVFDNTIRHPKKTKLWTIVGEEYLDYQLEYASHIFDYRHTMAINA